MPLPWQLSVFSAVSGFAPTVAPHTAPAHAVSSPVMAIERSAAIPFLKKPPALDGSMVGDVGFDPLGISTTILELGGDLKYVREAELMHGRQAMLACVGFVFPGAQLRPAAIAAPACRSCPGRRTRSRATPPALHMHFIVPPHPLRPHFAGRCAFPQRPSASCRLTGRRM